MILSLIVIAFICSMIWMWANQGLFSAFIQLMLTVIAGCAAFMIWESLVYGMLMGWMPEQAWGVGLLLPFGVSLVGMRVLFDRFIPGNLNFHNIVDSVGGAVFGAGAGILTAGMLLLGLQMVGMPGLSGYQRWMISSTGTAELNGESKLLFQADVITARFFTIVSDGAMSPIFGSATLGTHHPDLVREASFYFQSMNWKGGGHESSYRAISPSNIKLDENTGYIKLTDPPDSFKSLMGIDPNDQSSQLILVGTQIVGASEDKTIATDSGGIFRVTWEQLSLVAMKDKKAEYYLPRGYVQAGEYRDFGKERVAYSDVSGNATFYWAFVIPKDAVPLHLSIKQSRVELPDTPNTQVAAADSILKAGVKPVVTTSGTVTVNARVNPRLPTNMSRNKLPNVEHDDGVNLISGEFNYRSGADERNTSPALLLRQIAHGQSVRVVQVDLGSKSNLDSVINRLLPMSTASAPQLVASDGTKYRSIGYIRTEGAAQVGKIDPDAKMQSMNDLDLGSASANAQVWLYYHVDIGKSITHLEVDGKAINSNSPLIQNVQ